MASAAQTFCGIVLAAAGSAATGCVSSPKAEAARQQQMLDIGDAVNDLRITTAQLSNTLDSLRTVIAKQDTTLARLANVTGVVVAK
jgi:hypothetical protein